MAEWFRSARAYLGELEYRASKVELALYGICDKFGFNGDDVWMTRRDTLFAALHANPKAKWVTRVLQFGSEPLFDSVLPHDQLAEQVIAARKNLSSLHIPVTVSELAFGYLS